MQARRHKAPPPPLDEASLEAIALTYAARFATSRAKLAAYLARKLRERGWAEEAPADIATLVGRLADLRYVDDEAFAAMKGSALAGRGYGPRRVGQALDAAGIGEADRVEAPGRSAADGWEAAEVLARRKRIGPYGTGRPERDVRQKQIAAFVRAGHDFGTAAKWVDAPPGEPPEMA